MTIYYIPIRRAKRKMSISLSRVTDLDDCLGADDPVTFEPLRHPAYIVRNGNDQQVVRCYNGKTVKNIYDRSDGKDPITRERWVVNHDFVDLERRLRAAISATNFDEVDLLLRTGVNPDAIVDEARGHTALFHAVGIGHARLTNVLLFHGANVNFANSTGETPLMHAAASSQTSMVDALVRNGANVDAKTTDGKSAMLFAVMKHDAETVTALLNEGASADDALALACRENLLEIVRLLLARGADPNTTPEPLKNAVCNRNMIIVDLLLKSGADPNATTGYGRTPLMGAAYFNSVDVTMRLLKYEADPNIVDPLYQQGPLLFAAMKKNPTVIKLLLDAGARVNAADKFGVTALMMASQVGPLESVVALMNAGADKNMKAIRSKRDALDYARAEKNKEILEFLENF